MPSKDDGRMANNGVPDQSFLGPHCLLELICQELRIIITVYYTGKKRVQTFGMMKELKHHIKDEKDVTLSRDKLLDSDLFDDEADDGRYNI